jgi:biopolymer transport protein ExbD
MNGWLIWIDLLRILSVLVPPIASLLLFFAKTRRFQRVILRTIASLLFINFMILFFLNTDRWIYWGEASWFVRSLSWFFHDMKPMFIFYAIIIAISSIGYWVSKRRLSHQKEPDPSKLPLPTQLQQNQPMMKMGKIYSIVGVSLFAIGMLIFARAVIIEQYFFGIPLDLPRATYSKCISPFENLQITIDQNGNISNREKKLTPEEFQAILIETIADNPRSTNTYTNLIGRVIHQEYVNEITIQLRVDSQCPYKNLRPILKILREQNIRGGFFRTAEPAD